MQDVTEKGADSAAVRIPVSVHEEEGRIVIEPLQPTCYDFASLVAGITDGNRHELIEIGASAGSEVW